MAERKIIRSFCIREEETWKKFIEICKREQESASVKIEEFVKDYVLKHDEGNPQLKVESFIEGHKFLPIMARLNLEFSCPKRLWIDPNRHEVYCAKDQSVKIPEACQNCDDRERFVKLHTLGLI